MLCGECAAAVRICSFVACPGLRWNAGSRSDCRVTARPVCSTWSIGTAEPVCSTWSIGTVRPVCSTWSIGTARPVCSTWSIRTAEPFWPLHAIPTMGSALRSSAQSHRSLLSTGRAPWFLAAFRWLWTR